jgi:mono/diheme cytochrome c family protein
MRVTRRGIAAALALGAATLLAGCPRAEAPPTGEKLYLRYCASCHGVFADGRGPLADTLRRPPSDLTTIARRLGGTFDESYVMAVIDGQREVAEHGPREMPVWGAVFEAEEQEHPNPAYLSLLHARALTDYLRSIQQQPE